jgi:hypothetical protein
MELFMKISLTYCSILLFAVGIKANDIEDLYSKIVKSGVSTKVSANSNNTDLANFCAKNGQIRQYRGLFCETSSRVAAFILLVCRAQTDFIPSYCHYKAGKKFAQANNKQYPKTYEIYLKDSIQSPKPFSTIDENDSAIAREIKDLVAQAFDKYRHGALCNLLAQNLQARRKKWPITFKDNICTTEYQKIFADKYPSITP